MDFHYFSIKIEGRPIKIGLLLLPDENQGKVEGRSIKIKLSLLLDENRGKAN